MNKKEFLAQLTGALTGKVGADVVNENVKYYEDYINIHVRQGESEEDVIKRLGSPRLLAKSIIMAADDAEAKNYGNNNQKDSGYYSNQYWNNGYGNSGYYNNKHENNGYDKNGYENSNNNSGNYGIYENILKLSEKIYNLRNALSKFIKKITGGRVSDEEKIADTILKVLGAILLMFVFILAAQLLTRLLPVIILIAIAVYIIRLFKN